MNPIEVFGFGVLETPLNHPLVGRRTTEASGLLTYGLTGAVTDGRAYLFFVTLDCISSHVLGYNSRLGLFATGLRFLATDAARILFTCNYIRYRSVLIC